MNSINLFESSNTKKLYPADFIGQDSSKIYINDYENLFSDILEIIDLSISQGFQSSLLPNIISELLEQKDTIEFKTKIRQLYTSYFQLVFRLFSIEQLYCCKELLISATTCNDFGISIAAKFYLDLIDVYENKGSVDDAVVSKLNKISCAQISYSNFNNIFIYIPNRLFYVMSPHIRNLFIDCLLSHRPRKEDLFFIKKIYSRLLPSPVARIIKLISNGEISKKALLISLLPASALKLVALLGTGFFIVRHPYLLRAISKFAISPARAIFTLIRCFNFIALKSSNTQVIIHRAMGGVGDLVMLRVAINLHLKTFTNKLTLCVPELFFPIFSDISKLRLVKSGDGPILDGFKSYNFTDCPAGHFEGAQFPKVRTNRIAAFIYALNLFLPSDKDQYQLLAFDSSAYPINKINCIDHEGHLQNLTHLKSNLNRKVLFYQPIAADSYKSYLSNAVIKMLDEEYIVVLIGASEDFYRHLHLKNTYLLNEDLKGLISAVQLADVCVGVDSSLIHIARAWSKPIVAIFGPTDGGLLMKGYSDFRVVQTDSNYFCAPCWRNESIKCRWNQTFISDCLSRVDSNQIVNAVKNLTN